MDSQNLLKYNDKLYIPEEASVRVELLKRYYDDLLSEHFGVGKIFELISRKYFWKSMKADVKEYIKICDIC